MGEWERGSVADSPGVLKDSLYISSISLRIIFIDAPLADLDVL